MTTLDVLDVSFTGSEVTPQLDLLELTFDGGAPPSLDLLDLSFTGTLAAVPLPLAPRTVEPETLVTLNVTIEDAVVPDSWVWRRVSGPAITLNGTGGTRTFRAPSTADGSGRPVTAVVVVGVRAVVGTYTSPEVTCEVTVLPQTRWVRTPAGVWVGATRPAA